MRYISFNIFNMVEKQNSKNDLAVITELLNKFKTAPKDVRQKSYLEICKYPGSRFTGSAQVVLAFL